jgi:hypothetical protein
VRTLEDFCIGSLDLIIVLEVSNRHIENLEAKIFAVSLEGATDKLGPIVCELVWDPEPTDNGFDKLYCRLFVDLDQRGRFWPLIEFVDGDVEVTVSSDGPGEWS